MRQLVPLFITIVLFLGCDKGAKETSTTISVILDITDPHQLHPVTETIIPLFQLNKNENNEAVFRFMPLTDRELNPITEFYLPLGSISENENNSDDENYRKKQIIDFYDSIGKCVTEQNMLATVDTPLANSECFKTIVKELQWSNLHKSDSTVLLVYSDLDEHSSIFSVFNKDNRKQLDTNMGKVVRLFEENEIIPDHISSTTIIFIYNPKSRADDALYMKMVLLYKCIFEPRGVTIIVQANNKNIQL